MDHEEETPIATWAVLHLFCGIDPSTDPEAIEIALRNCEAAGNQVVTAAIFGHKADFAVMALGPNEPALRLLQTALSGARCLLRSSYVSRTEVSEYAPHMATTMRAARLQPTLPPDEMTAFCFYPMSKRRQQQDNWYALDYETRRGLMAGHGAIGRTFHGRVLQVITGSTGLDDYEWGVSLFARTPDDLKECVYTMRFDEASARFAEFGPFYYGTVAAPRGSHRTRFVFVTALETDRSEATVQKAHEALVENLRALERVVVAFSGGADSSLLAYVATEVLGRDNVLCATAISASLPADERHACAALANEWQMRHVFVTTNELSSPAYVANDLNRCYFCKDELMDVLGGLARDEDATIVLGVNLDDLGEHRPGQAAALKKGATFPLVESGFSKRAVRTLSKTLGLSTWNKPAAACLSSRVPHGTPVTIEILTRVERAEAALHRLGFDTLRVRHYDDVARIEVPEDDLASVVEQRQLIVDVIHAAGYRYATLDLEGFRSGNLAEFALRRKREV